MTDQKIEILFASIEKMNTRLGSIEAMMKSTTKKISEIEDSFQSDSDDSAWGRLWPEARENARQSER